MTCPGCSAGLPDSALSCPNCRKLVHADQLEGLAARAKEAWRLGHFTAERSLWAESMALLPDDTIQHQRIAARVAEIDQAMGRRTGHPSQGLKKASAGIGPALVLLATKGKFLLLGLAKVGTLLTMFVSLGVYWAMYGWALALGVVFSIYVHEMGHVSMIRRYGFPASAPMFIPGLGAFIQLRGMRLPPIPEARIGLAGPMYGLGAALVALAAYALTGARIWGVIAYFGAWVNLFNLIPVWQLDGSRGLCSLTRSQRGVVLAAVVTLWLLSSNPMLLLIALGCGYRLFTRDWQTEADNRGLLEFLSLLAALTAVLLLSAHSAATPGR